VQVWLGSYDDGCGRCEEQWTLCLHRRDFWEARFRDSCAARRKFSCRAAKRLGEIAKTGHAAHIWATARHVPVHTTAFGVYLPLPGLSQASRALRDQQGRQDSAWCSHECGPGSAISPGTLSYAPVRGRALFVPACRLERSVRDGQQAVQLDTSRAVCAPTMTLGCWRPYVEPQLPGSRVVSQDSAFRRPHPFALVRAGLCT
jgi:hypothetical protein